MANESSDLQERFTLLLVRYFDNDLTSAELAELMALLRTNPDCRRQFSAYATEICLIRETLGAEQQTHASLPPADTARPAATRWLSRRANRQMLVAATAAALLLAAMLIVWRPRHVALEDAVIGAVEPSHGDVRVVTRTGDVRVVAQPWELRSGDTVRTEELRGTAAVTYNDGTRLMLIGDTAVTCSGHRQKSVLIHHGTVALSVRPQPAGSPMIVATSAARIEVLGTEFCCRAGRDRTDVSVTQGSVRVVRTSDGRAVDVAKGKRLLATGSADLAVENVAGPPDSWELDFEQGPPALPFRGTFVTRGLPAGSKGGMAAVPADHKEGIFYEAASPEAWYRGLFAIHADTHIHVTYKMDRPGWINVFILARGRDPNGPHTGNYLLRGLRPPPPGKWQTASIPLTQFQRASAGMGPPPSTDEVPYLVLFSSPDDRGLVIDRMWMTRGGPGVAQYEDID